jgi:uncharacterized damage-inducible protein DinB
MTSEQLLKQIEVVRSITLKIFEDLTEEEADQMPNGFSNTIRWNLGHILIVQDQLANHFAGIPGQLPAEYISLFNNGTKPADWHITPPSLDVLAQHLKEQTRSIRENLTGRLDELATKPFTRLGFKMKTIGEILNFSIHHEGVHFGIINGLRHAIHAKENLASVKP